jgi:crossover junction endodeoxyribonuclease RuvC
MSRRKIKILAIDPGTKEMGVAFLENGDLIYYGVKTIKHRRSPHEILNEGRKIILRLIRDFKPDVLVYEKAFFSNNRSAALLNTFVDEIKVTAKRKGAKVIGYAPSTVKKAICGNGRASKKEVAKMIVSKFPELKVYLTQDRAWKEEYHQNMFDAVALGMMAVTRW